MQSRAEKDRPGPFQAHYRRAIVDLAVVFVVVLGCFVLFRGYDLFERLHDFTRSHEGWELDEIAIAGMAAFVGLFIFGLRRLNDQRREIRARQRAEGEANRLARSDWLTGLPNRRHFEEQFEATLSGVNDRRRLALMTIDLDRFKPINDIFGHTIGDQILIAFARRASDLVGSHGFLARVGGDEFALIVDSAVDEDRTVDLARNLLTSFELPLEIDEKTHIAVSVSIGIVFAPQHGTRPDELIGHADMALYRAKARGRQTYCVFEPTMDAEDRMRAQIEMDIHGAIAEGSIYTLYKPIVNLRSHEVIGFEAVARWDHPTLGEIPPALLTEVAEDIGLIPKLSAYLLHQACRDAHEWPQNLKLAFNLSRTRLADRHLVSQLIETIEGTGICPERLEVEINETSLVNDVAAAKGVLSALRAAGVSIALDDFGAGNCNLHNLREYRFDRVKIDRSFVAGADETPGGSAFIRAILSLCAALQLPVTAKGIENAEIMEFLVKEGCQEGQGPVFGTALGADCIAEFLESMRAPGIAV